MAEPKKVAVTCKRNLIAFGYGYFKYDKVELPADVADDFEAKGLVLTGHKDLKAMELKAAKK